MPGSQGVAGHGPGYSGLLRAPSGTQSSERIVRYEPLSGKNDLGYVEGTSSTVVRRTPPGDARRALRSWTPNPRGGPVYRADRHMIDSMDPTAEALTKIAGDACSAFGATRDAGADIRSIALQLQAQLTAGPQRQVYEAITKHPSYQLCLTSMAADPRLSAYVTDASGMQPFVMSSKGGGRISIDMLPLALFDAASTELFFSDLPFTAEALGEKVISNLNRLRQALAGAVVEVLTLVGYSGIPLAAGQKIITPWGEIVPVNAPYWLLPEAFFGSSFSAVGQANATAVLVTSSEEQVTISHEAQPTFPDLAKLRPVIERGQRIAMELVPLALVLATAGDDPLRPAPLWQMPVIPWSAGRSWSSWGNPRSLRQRSRPLEEADLAEVERWSKLVNDYHHDEIAFVGRRIVSAINARWTLDDVLVDSVIAWENLVGGAPETTFRTSAAMACLLEQEPDARLLLQHRLAAIYGARSDVVHGRLGGDVSRWQWRLSKGEEKVGLDAVANEALDVAMRGLKVMIERRPDLIKFNAAGRCERLLLGA
jgi:hypothetical protein